jgi:putative peptidoglycan lipid II flippase
LEVAWLFAVVRRHLPRWRPVTKLSPLAAAHLRGIVPAIAAALVAQADLMAARLFASGLPPGSLSSLTYGFQLASFLTGILGGSVVTAAYPRLGGGGPGRSFEIERAFGWILFVTLPATPLLLLAAPDIAAAAFLRGHFTPQALSLTTAAFRGFLLALPLRPLVGLGLRAAFARRQGGKAAIASAVSVTATVAGDLLLVPRLGVLGMAVAASAGQAVALVATISLLWEERASSRARLGGAKLIPVAVSAAPCAAAAWLLAPLGAGPLLECGVSLAALFAYLVLAHLAGVPEARSLTGAIRQRAFLRPRLGD